MYQQPMIRLCPIRRKSGEQRHNQLLSLCRSSPRSAIAAFCLAMVALAPDPSLDTIVEVACGTRGKAVAVEVVSLVERGSYCLEMMRASRGVLVLLVVGEEVAVAFRYPRTSLK